MKFNKYVLLLFLAILWGPSFLLIKLAIEDFSPLMTAALRIGLAALFINLMLLFKSQKLSRNLTFWRHALIAGFFAHAVPFLLFNWGEQHIDSGVASVLNGLTPLSTLLISHFSIKEERLTINKLVGVVVGFFGLVILMFPQFSTESNNGVIGVLAVTVGAISYGVAIVYARKNLRCTPAMHAPSAQLLITSVYMIPLALFMDGGVSSLTTASSLGWVSILILSFFGTTIAFIVYYKLLDQTSATFLSLVTYILPVFGVILGILFLDELMHIEVLIGMLLVVIGIIVSNSSLRFHQGTFSIRKAT